PTISLLALAPALLSTALHAQAAAPAPAAQTTDTKQPLAVLYVGSAEGPRTANLVDFLQRHFARVGTAGYPTVDAKQADAYAVGVPDAEMHPKENSIGIGPQPKLPADYARATVLVNGPGVIVAQQLGSKIDWY